MTEPTSPAVVKAGVKGQSNADINAALRTRAAKQAAKQRAEQAKTAKAAQAELARGEEAAAPVEGEVVVRVTRRGDGKISTGQHVAGIGEVHYEQGEEFICTESQYQALSQGPDPKPENARDWVELVK